MKTLKIKADDIENGKYQGDVSNVHGNIEIDANLGEVWFTSIKTSGYIFAGVGSGINAVDGIEADDGIEAGNSIEAGLSIVCKTLSIKLRIFAGICSWKIPTVEEKEIRCEELLSGDICYGDLVGTKKEENKKGFTNN